MATHHGCTGQPLEKDPKTQGEDIDTPYYYWEDIDEFEHGEHENHMQLRELRNEGITYSRSLKPQEMNLQRPYTTKNVNFTG